MDLWLSKGHVVDGIWIGSFSSDAKPAIQRIEDALQLIERCAPLHYRRIKNNLARIWVRLVPHGAGCYLHSLNACLLDERVVASETTTVEWIASAIVHEAIHARLEKLSATMKRSANGSKGFVPEENSILLDICQASTPCKKRSCGGSTGAVKKMRPIQTKTCGRKLIRATQRYSVIWERQNGS
jgi:hypothetical protein